MIYFGAINIILDKYYLGMQSQITTKRMKKVFVAYKSQFHIIKMAMWISRGVKSTGIEVVTKEISEIKSLEEITGFDGYILGASSDKGNIAPRFESFMTSIQDFDATYKLVGSFSGYSESIDKGIGGQAAAIILDYMVNKFNMRPFHLGPLRVRTSPSPLDTGSPDSLRIPDESLLECTNYGEIFGYALLSQP